MNVCTYDDGWCKVLLIFADFSAYAKAQSRQHGNPKHNRTNILKKYIGLFKEPVRPWPDHFFCHENFLLFFATRGEIFSLKFTKYRSADPLGELKRSPDPLAAIKGTYYKGRGKGREGGAEREGWWDEREKEGKPLLDGRLFKSRLRLCYYKIMFERTRSLSNASYSS